MNSTSPWNILYRGPLSSCNYDCGYCPFAKRANTAGELAIDAAQLSRFAGRIAELKRPVRILFTPWGEAMIHSKYQMAIMGLSHLRHVQRVAIQTNASASLGWLGLCNRESVALWCTFHPSETTVAKFLARMRKLDDLGIRHSVGTVGVVEHLPLIQELRRGLPESTYLWVNALEEGGRKFRYTPEQLAAFKQIDPLFELNTVDYPSRGKACHAGETSFTVDGEGKVRRCHFVGEVIGDFYAPDFADCLRERTCPNGTCGCHIGYVYLKHLKLDQIFREGVVERIPEVGYVAAVGGKRQESLAHAK